jgi:hypothetical protein
VASVEENRGIEILERLLVRYLGGVENNLAKQLLSRKQPEVAIRLKPQSYHTWNFSNRRATSQTAGIRKICPD